MRRLTVDELRANTEQIVGASTTEPTSIEADGRVVAVIMSAEAYERGEQERALLRLLLQSEQDIAADLGYELDDVMADADRVIEGDRP